MSMWEPFTEDARRGVVHAQEAARALRSNRIGTEHILLGIIASENLAVRVLTTLGFDVTKIRQDVEAAAERGSENVTHEMIFTPRAKRVIELAFEEARKLSDNFIGTTTMLLGVIRESDGLGGRVLKNLGIDADSVRAQALALRKAENEPDGS
jgi:ATP-dependent Clp protease ATP-binding subunit ClpC